MLKKKITKKQEINYLPVKPPRIDWNHLHNKQIRQYVYNNRLASVFDRMTGKQVREASRSEIANFLIELSHG